MLRFKSEICHIKNASALICAHACTSIQLKLAAHSQTITCRVYRRAKLDPIALVWFADAVGHCRSCSAGALELSPTPLDLGTPELCIPYGIVCTAVTSA
eukprot:scaffold178623_cov21-Tisochrysis_lutea.AAC.2